MVILIRRILATATGEFFIYIQKLVAAPMFSYDTVGGRSAHTPPHLR